MWINRRMNQVLRILSPVLMLTVPAIAQAEGADTVSVAEYANLRYRVELVDQDGFDADAVASTLMVKAGLKIGEWHGLSGHIEGEAIVRIGPEHYNDTTNGRTDYPIIADPGDLLLNQAYLRYRPIDEIDAAIGRQTINLDNQRWIGSVGWRQNDQTFDAGQIHLAVNRQLDLRYVHSWRVNRVFGPDSNQGVWHRAQINALNAGYKVGDAGTLTAYGYWLELPEAPSASSRTVGLRFSGNTAVNRQISVHYEAEYARQTDLSPNPASFNHEYFLIEPGISVNGFTGKLGLERLEGDGATAVQTPLATLHAFNGWADVFLTTPANGLRDAFADVSYKFDRGSLKGLTLRLMYHDFGSTVGDVNYGREMDASIAYPIAKNTILMAKFARYDARAYSSDRTKFWLSAQTSF